MLEDQKNMFCFTNVCDSTLKSITLSEKTYMPCPKDAKDSENVIEEKGTFTVSFLGRHKVGINKFLIPIKISLFCWFAGARITTTFMPVYLKHQGLTITHLSTLIAICVGFQFFFSMISGMLADRIGRVKPILFILVSIYFLTLMCFIIMPKIDECVTKNIPFGCFDDELSSFSAIESCQIFDKEFYPNKCSVISNATHEIKNRNCSSFTFLLDKKDITMEKSHFNGMSDSCLYQINFEKYFAKYISQCKVTNCTSLQVTCSSNDIEHCHYNRNLWIIMYGILYILSYACVTSVHRFFDVISADMAKQYNSDFGRQRLWSVVGMSAGPALVGLILGKCDIFGTENRYSVVFVCSILFGTIAVAIVSKMNLKFHKPAANVCKKSFDLVKNFEVLLFCILLLITGMSFGFQMSYGNWYLQDLGASDLLLGISKGMATVCGLPFLFMSKWFINKTGVRNFFVISLLSYVFYNFAFSIMREPWLAMGIELVNIFSYHLFWVAVMQYCEKIAPEELQATIKALAGSLHFNLARMGTAGIGVYIMSNYGGREAFRVLGCIALGYAALYGVYLIIQRLNKARTTVNLNWDDLETDKSLELNALEAKRNFIIPKFLTEKNLKMESDIIKA